MLLNELKTDTHPLELETTLKIHIQYRHMGINSAYVGDVSDASLIKEY